MWSSASTWRLFSSDSRPLKLTASYIDQNEKTWRRVHSTALAKCHRVAATNFGIVSASGSAGEIVVGGHAEGKDIAKVRKKGGVSRARADRVESF